MSETFIETGTKTLTPDNWERLCHTDMSYWGEPDRGNYCGAPTTNTPYHTGESIQGVCSGCGKPSCPVCEALSDLDDVFA